MASVTVHVNGDFVTMDVSPRASLLRALRDNGFTGLQGACEEGECGSCSVLLDDELVCACLVPAATCEGAEVTTVEGINAAALAGALAARGAVQCGFCTPGVVVAATALLERAGMHLTRDDVAAALAGNLCRCTGYQPIVDAVLDAHRARRT